MPRVARAQIVLPISCGLNVAILLIALKRNREGGGKSEKKGKKGVRKRTESLKNC